jgi:beta-galactosidase
MGSVPAPSSSSPNFDTLQIGEKPDFCNHNVLQRNRLPPRAYFLPTTSLLLNGIWDFNYASNPLEAPDPKDHNSFGGMLPADRDIFTPSESSDGALITNLDPHQPGLLWTTIQVPGNWQLQGHGRPQYTNVIYPFPVCPPYVPTDNPTGTYRRSFHIPSDWETSTQLRLRFDGVDSAFHVWVNGLLVGYSQGSRNPAEFDITTSVDRSAANEVFVRVYQWCDGSYIEDQDQWWLSGEYNYILYSDFH